jgi:hypothetical protein
MNEKEEVKRFIKKTIEERRNRKYQIFLPAEYEDERTIEFTQGEADDLMEELENKPDRKFSISLPPEYVEILDDMAKRDTKRWKLAKFTRNLIIKDAIEKYILDRGYIVTRKLLNFHEVAELEPLMALCKKAEKLRDFPAWARGYWRRHNLLTASHGEYIGNDSDDVVDKWFLDVFKEMRKERKTK